MAHMQAQHTPLMWGNQRMSRNHNVNNLILGPGNVDSLRALQDHLLMTENACCKGKMGW